jgi:hypothetical protein
VAYTVLRTNPVIDFVRNLKDLSKEDRLQLHRQVFDALREHGDVFRELGERTPGGEFWHGVILHRQPPRAFRFLVNDTAAVYGILQVVYGEEIPGG